MTKMTHRVYNSQTGRVYGETMDQTSAEVFRDALPYPDGEVIIEPLVSEQPEQQPLTYKEFAHFYGLMGITVDQQ